MTTLPPPPPLEALPAGTRLRAGLGHSTVLPDLDFETYSEAGMVFDPTTERWHGPPGAPGSTKGLPVVGARIYAEHPSTEVLCLAYDLKDGRGRRQWRPGLPWPTDLFHHVWHRGLLEAWNVGFERWIWELVCVPRMGWPEVHPSQWRCAMAKARAFSLPGSLDRAGAVLSTKVRKGEDGRRLLTKFSMPRNPTKTDSRRRVYPMWTFDASIVGTMKPAQLKTYQQDVNDSNALLDYNETDIAAEAEISSLVPDIEGEELEWWQVDQAINHRGVHVDSASIEACIAVIENAHARYNAELFALTGIDAASKVQQLLGWLHGRGVHLDSLDEEAVELALSKPLPAVGRRVLEIRAAIGSASVKKVFAMRNRTSSLGRMHDLFIYYGARTGRPTGEGPQPTNSPKAGPDLQRCGQWVKGVMVEGTGCGRHFQPRLMCCPWCGRSVLPRQPVVIEWNPEAAEDALQVLATRSLDWVELVFGDAMHAIAGCIRSLYNAAPGHDLISTDYNSIEAVGLAMISGEQWRIEVFRSHGKIYETSAAMMYRIPFEDFAKHKAEHGQHHPLRQKGKIAELAFGYQGWIGAAAAFGMPGTEDEIKSDILAWRRASPSVEWLWGGQTMGKAAGVLDNAGRPIPTDRWDRTPYYFGVEGMATLAVMQPGEEFPVARLDGTDSGILFVMRGDVLYCRLPSGRYLTYHRPRLRTSDRGGLSLSYEGANTNPKNGPVGWIRMDTWGGRLVENINQATCRDLLRFACINLERAGYPVVLHVYDEIVSEIPEGWGSIEEFERIVTTPPEWAREWPIKAPGGWRAKRYRKG